METNGEVANGYSKSVYSEKEKQDVTNGNTIKATPLQKGFPEVCEATDNEERYCELGVVHRLSRSEVPDLFVEPHVRTGFRPLHRPWWYYPLTVLHLHNESMNIWTHAFAVLLMFSKLVRFSFDLDFLNDPYTWPLLAGFFCGFSLFTGSAGAHCMQSKSELYHYTVFMVDYAGIGLYGLGSVIVHLEYCSEDGFYRSVKPWFIPAGCVIAVSICFCSSLAKVIYERPYPFKRKLWQMLPVLAIYALLISPIVHHLVTYYSSAAEFSPGISYHLLQIFWFFLSGLFFASDFPQRFFPGMCDYFFHSHQLFHVAIMTCILYQMEGVFADFRSRRPLVTSRPPPTLTSAFGPVLVTMAAEAVVILGFWYYIKEYKLKLHGQSEKSESQKNK